MIAQFLAWYLVIQVISLAAMPLCLRLFVNLPDRGYAFAKSLGILLVGFVFWWGYSYGLLGNNNGSAWLSVALVAALSYWIGRSVWQQTWSRRTFPISLTYIGLVEALFLVGFAAWAIVRAYDPAINHTEQPMDLMFINSIWAGGAFPPQDAWLAGYGISYYYFGYWLLAMLARLSGQLPEVAYNLGQASWFGLLLVGAFGVVYDLLAENRSAACGLLREAAGEEPLPYIEAVGDSETTLSTVSHAASRTQHPPLSRSAVLGGLLSSVMVAVAGNGQALFEWLYANGRSLDRLIAWFGVYNFPENAAVTNQWYIGYDWWWWRSSRVLEDLDLLGNHIEVIDEFPMFSYILGDNHPHVLAMPMVILVIAMALNLFLQPFRNSDEADTDASDTTDEPAGWHILDLVPLRIVGLLALVIATGALIFFNTWDFPPYWALLVVSAFIVGLGQMTRVGDKRSWGKAVAGAAIFGAALAIGTGLLYLPYFLTAQSQAGGFVPNLFNPTRFSQFLLMFSMALPALTALVIVAWQALRPRWNHLAVSALTIYGLPLLFLALTTLAAGRSSYGIDLLARLPLPPGASSHTELILQRWTDQPWTFLLIGALLSVVAALVWKGITRIADREPRVDRSVLFVLLLAGLGLVLVYAPEFVYLRDNFGTRMNTIFKFYYQSWLLFGLSGSYAIVQALRPRQTSNSVSRIAARIFAIVALVLVATGLIYPVAGVYSKTVGFRSESPTFDGIAHLQSEAPAELAAARWVRTRTAPNALVLEGRGASYRANTNRISSMTGRPTLLGWDGHESQWRGSAYGEMAAGRAEAIELIYRTGSPQQIVQTLDDWGIDYVYIGPSERAEYGITSASEERLAMVMELVFAEGDVRIYRRRG